MKEKDDHYEEVYGLKPYFKAGAHMGRVTVAEVGVLKRSIAFHGDTVNTTSRIHDQCNNYQQQLLVSRDLLSRLIDRSKLKYVFVGDEILKADLVENNTETAEWWPEGSVVMGSQFSVATTKTVLNRASIGHQHGININESCFCGADLAIYLLVFLFFLVP